MDFINNDGSYAHRGVWHVTDNLVSEFHPANVRENVWQDIIYRHEEEEYTVYTGDAICGQRDKIQTGGLHWGNFRVKPVDGVTTIKHRAIRPDIVLGLDGYIPGPLCTRCARKAGLEGF